MIDGGYLPKGAKILLVIQVVIITILIPITVFFLLRSLGRIDTIMVKDLGQRRLPLVAQALLFFLLLRESLSLEYMPELYFFFVAVFISTIGSLLSLLLRVKSSLHMAGMGGLVFFIIGLSFHNAVNVIHTVAFLFVMTGFVASSRLQMKAHDNRELIVGFLIGMLPQVCLFPLWL